LNEISKFYPDLSYTMGQLDRHTRWAVRVARKSLKVTEDNIDGILSEYVEKPNPHGIVLDMQLILPEGLSQTLREKIIPLYRAGRVLAMHITFRKEDVKFGEDYSCRLVLNDFFNALERFTPFLEELKLDFSALGDDFNDFESGYLPSTIPRCKVGFAGCGEIAQLRYKLPALLTLSLELNGNEIGDIGLEMLTMLKHYTLKTLYLGLKNNNIGHESMRGLLTLADTYPLEALHIELEDNHIGNPGAIWLSKFGESRYGGVIRTLHLGLQNNGIGDIGADILKRHLLRVTDSPGFPGIPRDSQSSPIERPGLQVNLDNNPIASDHPPRVPSRNNPGNIPPSTDTSVRTTADGNLSSWGTMGGVPPWGLNGKLGRFWFAFGRD
jgi:hypothetical protein